MSFNVPSISDIIVVLPCKLKRDQDRERHFLIKVLAHHARLLLIREKQPDLRKRDIHKSELVPGDRQQPAFGSAMGLSAQLEGASGGGRSV